MRFVWALLQEKNFQKLWNIAFNLAKMVGHIIKVMICGDGCKHITKRSQPHQGLNP
jgi:hypothetical protein